MSDSSPNQIWSFGDVALKRTHAGTGDSEYVGPRLNNHCSREERASPARYFLTHNCKAFQESHHESLSILSGFLEHRNRGEGTRSVIFLVLMAWTGEWQIR